MFNKLFYADNTRRHAFHRARRNLSAKAVLWFLVVIAVVLLFVLASLGRKARQRSALHGLRAEFPRIARLHLVAACPALDGVLRDAELRLLLDWMLIELCRRTGASGFDELMRWSLRHGEAETTGLTADVSREAVDRLPRPVLAVLDDCGGRAFASVLLDQSLTEAGQRIAPKLRRGYA